MRTLLTLTVVLWLAAPALAGDAAETVLARLRAGNERAISAAVPRASRLALADAEATTRTPVVAVTMPAAWAVSAADVLDLYPQDLLRLDADDPRLEASLAEAGRLGVGVILVIEPDADAAKRRAATLRHVAAARVEAAWLDAATGRLHWLNDVSTTPAHVAPEPSTGLPWAALLGLAVAAGIIVWTRRPDLVRTAADTARRVVGELARDVRDRVRPPRPSPEAEAAVEVGRVRADNPRLFAVLGRLQEAQRDEPAGLPVEVDAPADDVAAQAPPLRLHALLAAERLIPAALSGSRAA